MKKLTLIFILVLFPANCFAVTLFFDPPGKNVKEGEQFYVEFMVNPEEEFINALEGVIEFPKNIIKPIGIDISNSIISAWVESPNIVDGKIKFSGIIAGGFDGVRKPLESKKYPGNLFRLIFETKNVGSGAMIVESIKVLKNDGLGSEADSVTIPFAINIIDSGKKEPIFDLPVILVVVIMFVIGIIVFKVIRKIRNE